MDIGKICYFLIVAGICMTICGIVTWASDQNNSNATVIKEIVEVPVNNTSVVGPVVPSHNDTSESNVDDNSMNYSGAQTYVNDTPSLEDQMLTREREKYEAAVKNGSETDAGIEHDSNVLDENFQTNNTQINNTSIDDSNIESNSSSPDTKETPVTQEVSNLRIESNKLSTGYLSYKAPLTYYNVKAGKGGVLDVGVENEGKEFVVIPV